jgi:hypothetical protein
MQTVSFLLGNAVDLHDRPWREVAHTRRQPIPEGEARAGRATSKSVPSDHERAWLADKWGKIHTALHSELDAMPERFAPFLSVKEF